MRPPLNLRKATTADADFLLRLRNDAETRRQSRTDDVVSAAEHAVWLEAVLGDADRRLYIAEMDGAAVGTGRADRDGNTWELSWTVAPEARGRGIGKALVKNLADGCPDPVTARIRVGNPASEKAAAQAGLEMVGRIEGFGLWSQPHSTEDSVIKQRRVEQYRMDKEPDFLRPDPPFPRNMMVELTNGCNHACIFCANPHMHRKIGRIDTGLLFRLMDEAYALGTREIGFYTTGEPFVHKDLAAFTKRAKDTGYTYTYISTNGALATPERAKAVIDAGMDSIKFSINAGSRETYAMIHGKDEWDQVIENIRFISKYRAEHARHVNLAVTCVVTQQIVDEVETARALFEPLVDDIWFPKCSVQSGQMNGAQALLGFPEEAARGDSKLWVGADHGVEEDDKGICHLPFNRLHVTCEGYLSLCCVDYQNYLAIADLNQTSLAEAWTSHAFANMRRRHLERNLSGTLCGNCWLGETKMIEPLKSEMADAVDFERFYDEQKVKVLDRLATLDTEKT